MRAISHTVTRSSPVNARIHRRRCLFQDCGPLKEVRFGDCHPSIRIAHRLRWDRGVEADGHEGCGATRHIRPIHGRGDATRLATSSTSGESAPMPAGERRQVAQRLVQRRERLSNVDQLTNASTQTHPFGCSRIQKPIRHPFPQVNIRCVWSDLTVAAARLPLHARRGETARCSHSVQELRACADPLFATSNCTRAGEKEAGVEPRGLPEL